MRYRNHFAIPLSAILIVIASATVRTQDRRNALGSTTMREPNVAAPNLYADKIKLKVTLANLPGADNPNSSWDGSYQIYFIPEADYYGFIENLPSGSQSLSPAQFPHKRLLVEGTIKKSNLSSLQERTVWRSEIDFKNKVPGPEQTKFGRLLTSYSVKIYDGQLKTPFYHAGAFVTYVFDKTATGATNAAARQTLYLNFTVTPQGTLSYSQLATQ